MATRKSFADPWLRLIESGAKTFEGRVRRGFWADASPGTRLIGFSAEREVSLKVVGVRVFPSFSAAVEALGEKLIPREGLSGGKELSDAAYKKAATAVYADIYKTDKPAEGVVVLELAVDPPSPPPIPADAPTDAPIPAPAPPSVSRLSRNSTSFMHLVTQRLRDASYPGMFPHQARTLKYATTPEFQSGNIDVDGRGLLVTDEMGTGKGITISGLVHYMNMPTILISTRPLLAELSRNAEVFERVSGKKIDWSRVRCASMNASNTGTQLARAVDGVVTPLLEQVRTSSRKQQLAQATSLEEKEVMREIMAASADATSLNDILVIVDEAHLLARGVANGSKNATIIYNAIKRSPTARVFLFTGTPGVDDPFEMGLLFNMVGPASSPPFPENYVEFTRYFVDRSALQMLNTGKWMNRISGLQTHHSADASELPVLTEVRKHFVAMDPHQYEEYGRAREKEMAEDASSRGEKKFPQRLQRPKGARASTYRVRSRQAGDSYMEHADGTGVTPADDASKSPLVLRSPKATLVVDIATKAPRVTVVYTQFVARGERAIAVAADAAGWTRLNAGAATPQRVYASVNGSVSSADQDAILRLVNDASNANGERVKLVIVSVVAAVGMNFLWGSDAIIYEPYWNVTLHDQFFARIRRQASLPGVKDRRVTGHILFAVPPEAARVKPNASLRAHTRIAEGPHAAMLEYVDGYGVPTDISLWLNGVTAGVLMTACRELGRRASINAVVEKRADARLCKPTGTPLFFRDIFRDMTEPDPCRPYEKTTVEATPVEIGGAAYYYWKNAKSAFGWELFQKNASGDGYLSVPPSSPAFQEFLGNLP